MKLISFVVPCYNSQEYMRHCIDTLLPGGDQIEILIVNATIVTEEPESKFTVAVAAFAVTATILAR